MTQITFRLDDPPEEIEALAVMLENLPSVIRLREAREKHELDRITQADGFAPVSPETIAIWKKIKNRDNLEDGFVFCGVDRGAAEGVDPRDQFAPAPVEGEDDQLDLLDEAPTGWVMHENGTLTPVFEDDPAAAEDAPPPGAFGEYPGVEPEPERDSTGAVWDPELHASSKGLTKDGKWRARRGSGEAPPPPPPVAVAPPPPPPVAVAPPPPPPPAVTFAQCMTKITPGLGDGSLDMATITKALNSVGLPNLPALNKEPHLIPDFLQRLGL